MDAEESVTLVLKSYYKTQDLVLICLENAIFALTQEGIPN